MIILNIKNSLSKLYNWSVFLHRSVSYAKSYDINQVCIIAIGNVSMGGTGKTPTTLYIAKQLIEKKNEQVAIISRGYKRKTKGLIEVQINSSADQVGDEPLLIKKQLPDAIVLVSKDRNLAIQKILDSHPEIHTILLDDGLQHWRVRPHISILLTSYHQPYFNDHVFPRGNLRESKSGADRADLIVVTKCPELDTSQKQMMINQVNPLQNQSVFFSQIIYKPFQCIQTSQNKDLPTQELSIEKARSMKWCLVTGIADSKPLIDYLEQQEIDFIHRSYPDHHDYSIRDIEYILSSAHDRSILTTEKDIVKWIDLKELFKDKPIYTLPISIQITSDAGEDFLALIDKKKHSFRSE